MLDLLGLVHQLLDDNAIPHALIGAGAMSVVGYVRSTQDLDVLVTREAVLNADLWAALAARFDVQINDGRHDFTDPLAGLVRIEDPDTLEEVDVVVGRHPRWQDPILARAVPTPLSDTLTVGVAQPADLVLLKLFAGSNRDDHDIRMLLNAIDGLEAIVDSRIDTLPKREQARWSRVKTTG